MPSKYTSIWNKLTKKELVHVIENCLVINPIQKFKETRKQQIDTEKTFNNISCWDCELIARKLGIE